MSTRWAAFWFRVAHLTYTLRETRELKGQRLARRYEVKR